MSLEMSTLAAAPKQVISVLLPYSVDQFHFQVLTPYDIQAEISSCIFKVRSLLQVDSSYSLTLLLKFKWDMDALKESFHASQDLSDFLVSNNVTLKRWEKACKEHHALGKVADIQTWEYIQKYTEDCPHCLAFIVKNGGCSHMTCSKCRHEFCWDCREPWRYGGHHGNGCRHIKNPSNRPNLENIAPYIISFNHHKQRLRNNRDTPELKTCHRTLMYTYVYGYYQEPGSDKEVFEKLQKDLEMEITKSAQFWRSRQRMERCELLRKLLLDYCSSNRMDKKDFMIVKSNAKKGYMNYISSLLLALLLVLVLLIMIIVFFVQTC
ncbi:hypothetical protein CAEBREN_01648 [Caenorhabditis brenneri]|uniref:RBR-type E3 ubiquitin transferase n=1 Tax=Caenorhabditis brenneri TaxID=135651 RepID=G0MMK3_CAEBE|nr:hypothetical protein CAEBREN_01648 [Caenorhabditis brenneri]